MANKNKQAKKTPTLKNKQTQKKKPPHKPHNPERSWNYKVYLFLVLYKRKRKMWLNALYKSS